MTQTQAEKLIAGEPGRVNSRITARKIAAWKRRARTIELKAQALLCDMLDLVGPEDPLTDFADNAVSAAVDIGDLLDRALAAQEPHSHD